MSLALASHGLLDESRGWFAGAELSKPLETGDAQFAARVAWANERRGAGGGAGGGGAGGACSATRLGPTPCKTRASFRAAVTVDVCARGLPWDDPAPYNALAGLPSSLHVRALHVSCNSFVTAAPVRGLTTLTRLVWNRAIIQPAAAWRELIQGLPLLQDLDLQFLGHRSELAAALTAATGLTRLKLTGTHFQSCTFLRPLTLLRSLSLHNCGVPAVLPPDLLALTGLTRLGLVKEKRIDWELDQGLTRLSRLAALNLRDNEHLAGVPPQLRHLTTLQDMDLAYNSRCVDSLDMLPPQLQALSLGYCMIAEVRSTTGGLCGILWACARLSTTVWCPVPQIPETLTRLTALTRLSLSDEGEVMPENRSELRYGWRHLRALTTLRDLDLSGTALTMLPAALTALTALTRLGLKELPRDILFFRISHDDESDSDSEYNDHFFDTDDYDAISLLTLARRLPSLRDLDLRDYYDIKARSSNRLRLFDELRAIATLNLLA